MTKLNLCDLTSDEVLLDLYTLSLGSRVKFYRAFTDKAAAIKDLGGDEREFKGLIETYGRALWEEKYDAVSWYTTAGDIYAELPPKPSWVVDELLRVGGMSLLSAEPKTGKSTLMRWLAACMITNTPWLGRKVIPGKVLYYALEDPVGMAEDLYDFGEGLGFGLDEMRESVKTVRRQSIITDPYTSLKNIVEGDNINLVILDTLQGFAQLGEFTNDYGKVQEEMQKLKIVLTSSKWAAKNTHILMVHHQNKQSSGNLKNPFLGITGSSAFRGSTDCNMVMVRHNGQVILAGVEGRRIKPLPQLIIHLEPKQMTWNIYKNDEENQDKILLLIEDRLLAGPMNSQQLVDEIQMENPEIGDKKIRAAIIIHEKYGRIERISTRKPWRWIGGNEDESDLS